MNTSLPGFSGIRLSEMRCVNGYTQASLAKEIGITNKAISSYESGGRKPSWDILSKLAAKFDVPVHFFMVPIKRNDVGAIYYRSMVAATKIARTKAEIYYAWLRDILSILHEYVEFLPNAFPDCILISDPNEIDDEMIDQVASQLKISWNVDDSCINNIVGLIESKGGVVVRRRLGTTSLDAFSNWSPDDHTPYFILNTGKSAVRSRFDIAHELGHVMLHRNIPEHVFNDPIYFKEIERQAHYFAGTFLLPEDAFLKDVPFRITLDTLLPIKSKWKVSLAAIVMRLRNLRLIDETKFKRLFYEMSRRGWRKEEPLDNYFQYEEPLIIKRAFEVMEQQGIDCSNLFKASLGLSNNQVEQATGLSGFFSERKDRDGIIQLTAKIKLRGN